MGAKEGGVAAFELPRVTSGRPFRSPRGDCELSLVSSPFSPAVPSVTIVDRDGVGWFPSVCLDQGLRHPLQEARSDRGDRASMRPGETGSGFGTVLSLYSKGISNPLLDG